MAIKPKLRLVSPAKCMQTELLLSNPNTINIITGKVCHFKVQVHDSFCLDDLPSNDNDGVPTLTFNYETSLHLTLLPYFDELYKIYRQPLINLLQRFDEQIQDIFIDKNTYEFAYINKRGEKNQICNLPINYRLASYLLVAGLVWEGDIYIQDLFDNLHYSDTPLVWDSLFYFFNKQNKMLFVQTQSKEVIEYITTQAYKNAQSVSLYNVVYDDQMSPNLVKLVNNELYDSILVEHKEVR